MTPHQALALGVRLFAVWYALILVRELVAFLTSRHPLDDFSVLILVIGGLGGAAFHPPAAALVYKLADYRNSLSPVIPERVITRAPSAELRPDQTDQDSLPPYEVLDGIMEAYMEHNRSPREIAALGYAAADVQRVVSMIRRSEYKRRQAPPGVRITFRGFGKDWRYPITSKYLDDAGLSL